VEVSSTNGDLISSPLSENDTEESLNGNRDTRSAVPGEGRVDQARWRELTEWPLTAGALLFLAAYACEVLIDLPPIANDVAEFTTWAIWGLFAVDYIVNLFLAPARWRWFFTHFHEFLIVVLPVLRPLRLLRLVKLLSILQTSAGTTFRGRVVVYAAGSSLLLITVAALAMLDVERNVAGATITSFGAALWWAIVTITTVGYGDLTPVTMPGRVIAVGIMIAGIALLGTVTAMLASWFLDRVTTTEKRLEAVTRKEITDLSHEIAQLRELLSTQRAEIVSLSEDDRQPRHVDGDGPHRHGGSGTIEVPPQLVRSP
jgi:voltage-gated potassium channel